MREAIEKDIYIYTLKIPKISPGASVFERPFLRGLFLEGLRPVSNVVLRWLDCSTTWFQTSNLIQSNRPAVAKNTTQK